MDHGDPGSGPDRLHQTGLLPLSIPPHYSSREDQNLCLSNTGSTRRPETRSDVRSPAHQLPYQPGFNHGICGPRAVGTDLASRWQQ